MRLVCTMPCRNEDWVIGCSARAALEWVDHLVVLNHASTDRTGEILLRVAEEYPNRVTILNETGPVWEEMKHRQLLLSCARDFFPTHIVMVDADEVLTANLVPNIRSMIEHAGVRQIVQLPWICLAGGLDRYYDSGVWAEQYVSMAFTDRPELHWIAREGYDFHHRHPMGQPCIPYRPVTAFRQGGLMHLQFVSKRRLAAKQALYKMTEVVRWPGREPVHIVDQRYNVAVYGGPVSSWPAHMRTTAVAPVDLWWDSRALVINLMGIPWQETECRKLLAEYGSDRFAGLDLFGVV